MFDTYLWQGSTIPTYQKINAFMESAKPSVYTSGNSAGIDRVRKEDGLYAFFMEAAAIEYHVERKCDLKQLGGLLDSKGYGIALPKGRYVIYLFHSTASTTKCFLRAVCEVLRTNTPVL